MRSFTVAVDVGDLQIFESHEMTRNTPSEVLYEEYYWRFKSQGEIYGPFFSVTEAMAGYVESIKPRKAAFALFYPPPFKTKPPKDNVIYVDFVSKRRFSGRPLGPMEDL